MEYVEQQRTQFKRATRMVDYIMKNTPFIAETFPFSMTTPNLPGNARADLINYILDGSLPMQNNTGLNEKMYTRYLGNIVKFGNQISLQNSIDIRQETQMNANQLLNNRKTSSSTQRN